MGFVATAVASLGAKVGGAVGLAGPLTKGTSLLIGAGTIAAGGGAAFGATKLLGSLTPKIPGPGDIPAAPAAPTFEGAQATAREDTLDLLRRKRAGTILTSPQGLLSTEQTTQKTLLGA